MARSELAGTADAETQTGREFCPNNRFFHLFMAGVSAVLIAMAVICVTCLSYRLSAPTLGDYVGVAAFLLAAGYCWRAKHERFFQVCLIVFWSFLMGKLLGFPVYLAARSRFPLQDDALARFDRMLGVQVPSILHFCANHPWIKESFAASYDWIFPLMVLSVMLPAVLYRWTAAKELVIASSLATIVGSMMFAVCPAIGPWTVYHFAPSAQQQTCEALFLTLRSGSFHTLSPDDKGIICFPSFHVMLAIVSCVAICSIKVLRIPAVLVASLIVISTLTTGWHYIADVIGGLTLAVLAELLAKGFTRIEARFSPR
ncbi:MAG: phosphatase PAP2 family protein [Terracidiphilus sp.]